MAALAEWKYPVSREWIVLTHLYDLLATVNSKNRPKPYPTPWSEKKGRLGGKKIQARSEVLRRLESMNPKEQDYGN